MEKSILEKIIINLNNIYPNASKDFIIGAKNYLRGIYNENYLYQESSEFKIGYYQIQDDLDILVRKYQYMIDIK